MMRVGFVGELGYELHVPSPYIGVLWDRLIEVGEGFGIRPFGVEAQRLLRLEKGHIIVGQDTDGMTQPDEVSLAGRSLKRNRSSSVRKAWRYSPKHRLSASSLDLSLERAPRNPKRATSSFETATSSAPSRPANTRQRLIKSSAWPTFTQMIQHLAQKS